MLIKVQNNNDLVRDSNSQAIINNNESALEAYRKQRKILSEKVSVNEINSLREQFQDLKNDLEIIKQLLLSK